MLLPLLLAASSLAAPPPQDVLIQPRQDDHANFTLDNIILERAAALEDRAINTCGCASVPSTSRIVGGSEVNPKYKLPYQALFYPCLNGGGCGLCGGTIVNKRFVITAAHCLFQGSTAVTTSNGLLRVVIGEHSICDGVTNEGGKFIKVKTATVHPSYTFPNNDIAVLELEEDITFTTNIQPACLPTSATKDYSGKASTISGWGGTIGYAGHQPQPQQPRQCGLKESVVQVLSTSSSMCSSYLGTSSSTNRLCAWAKGTDTCQGDSGGPLTVAEGGKYTLLGVVSYGAGCASSTPGIYARVQGFLPWIHSLISSGECSTGSTGSTTTTTTTGKPTSGTFSSKNFPSSYPINFDETKTIEVDSGRRIKVTFTAFSLEQGWNCVWDYLQVTDGDGSVLLKKSCGTTKPDPFTSKTNKINVIFHSDYSVTSSGFNLAWSAV